MKPTGLPIYELGEYFIYQVAERKCHEIWRFTDSAEARVAMCYYAPERAIKWCKHYIQKALKK